MFRVILTSGALILVCGLGFLLSCTQEAPPVSEKATGSDAGPAKTLVDKYTSFTLTADLSGLTDNQKAMIPILIDVAQIMDDLFWQEAYGSKQALIAGIEDPDLKRFAEINYGPWDRLDNNKPFVEGVGPKPAGAQFYPTDATREEIEGAEDASVRELYTMVRRDESGNLKGIPYHEYFEEETLLAAAKLKEAAKLAEDAGLKNYLSLRAEALLTDDYLASDMAWMDMKDNTIDFVVGPIEVYEDQMFNQKAAHEAFILIKDKAWSDRLAKYAALLPELQKGLPVDAVYKSEIPGSDSDLNAYDAIYYAGDCNAGSKTIAINLPNDERVQLEKGARRLQLKNAMRAKFEKILLPIADVLIVEEQRSHITFNAFFANTMFHEVAHGLGIKETVNDKGPVREAMKEMGSIMEEGKADILGLYMVSELLKQGHLEGDIQDFYVTFVTGIFRSVRFGASSAHGKANMMRFNFFQDMGAFTRDEVTGMYRVDFDKMPQAVEALSRRILMTQGDGDYEGAKAWIGEKGVVNETLKADLKRLEASDIPVDVVFEQGLPHLDLGE